VPAPLSRAEEPDVLGASRLDSGPRQRLWLEPELRVRIW